MRIWDIAVRRLCRQHLLGEHRELHAVWAIVTGQAKRPGYENHPETKRWVGRTYPLERRHVQQVLEMRRRGWDGHKTRLSRPAGSSYRLLRARRYAVNTLAEQVANLRGKGCDCDLAGLVK